MAKLETELKEWVTRGFLTEEQSRVIQNYESTKTSSSWFMSGLLILGAVIIGIGVISVIASNWAQIPDAAKLFLDFLILAILALSAIRAERDGQSVVFEVLLVSLLMMVLASIGLISQVYNTGGKLHQALLFSSFITLGVALVSRKFFAPFLWSGIFMAGLSTAGFESEVARLFFEKNTTAILALNPLMAAIAAGCLARFTTSRGLTQAFRWWILWAGIAVLLVQELDSAFSNYYSREGIVKVLYGFGVLIAIDVLTCQGFRKIQKGMLLAVLGGFLIACSLPSFGLGKSLHHGIASIVVLSLAGIFLASLHARGLFQLLVSLVGLRFLVLYFQAFGGLATTGVGLIISGVFVIGSAILWNKYRNQLTVWAEGMTR